MTRQGKPAAGCLSPVVSLRPRTAFTRWKEIPLPRSSRAGRGRRGLRLAPAGLRHGTWRARLTISGSTRPTSSGHERMCVEGSRIYQRKAIGEAVRPGRGPPLPSSGVSASRRPNARRPGLRFSSLASQGLAQGFRPTNGVTKARGLVPAPGQGRRGPSQFTITGVMSSWCRCRSLSRAKT